MHITAERSAVLGLVHTHETLCIRQEQVLSYSLKFSEGLVCVNENCFRVLFAKVVGTDI